MKRNKIISVVALAILASVLTCGCEVTIKHEDDEYKEKYETLVSEIQNKSDHDQVKAMAKDIYTAMSVYLTTCGINDDAVAENLTYDSLLDDLINDCGLPAVYKTYNLNVTWKYNTKTYSVQEVTVTVDGITEKY